MKIVHVMIGLLLSTACFGNEPTDLSAERIKSLVLAVNEASNRMMMSGSRVSDVDSLFSMYSDDFVYIHDAYGGLYTREHLYENSVKHLNAGRYDSTQGRYKVLNVMTGLNAAAVERLEVESGEVHLSVFEFKDEKVSRVIEYWK